ncbi:MAG: hypothetical protein NC247_05740 [Ruminococcus flavefaciens]|nr:hypothetical protein [Ruminococcus flavefaciens]MCM1361803.1 hypothetical protein [Clostridiales bacterium]MCM1435652.1 hypothetical protein [Ruminococcus flavefaciens]
MKQNEYEAMIAQNTEKIQKKEAQIKKFQNEIRELKAKNAQLQDDLLLYQVKNQIAGKDITKLIMISQLIDESGLSDSDLKEFFSKGEVKNED